MLEHVVDHDEPSQQVPLDPRRSLARPLAETDDDFDHDVVRHGLGRVQILNEPLDGRSAQCFVSDDEVDDAAQRSFGQASPACRAAYLLDGCFGGDPPVFGAAFESYRFRFQLADRASLSEVVRYRP